MLHWLVVSKPCKMNHWGSSKSCGWTKTCWNRQPDQQSFKQFQGPYHMFSIPQPRCVSHRPLSPVLPESCFMLFNPVRSWATSGKTGGNYGSGRLYQREFFFLPWGRESAKCSKWCMILHMLSVFSLFCMGRNTNEFIPTNSNSYHWIDWREHFTWKIPINLMDKNHVFSR